MFENHEAVTFDANEIFRGGGWGITSLVGAVQGETRGFPHLAGVGGGDGSAHDGAEKAVTLRSDIGHGEWDDKRHGFQCAGNLDLGRIVDPKVLKLVVNAANLAADSMTATKEISFLQERT